MIDPLTLKYMAQEKHAALRDYFAMAALPALINHPGAEDCSVEEIVSDAYLYADAMLKQRQKPPKGSS